MTSIRKTKKTLKRKVRRTELYLKGINPTTMDLMRDWFCTKMYLSALKVRLRFLKGKNFPDAKFILPNDIKIEEDGEPS